jgi:Mg/Co/Ni transporter MgtE
MAKTKTHETTVKVTDFLDLIEDERRRKDAYEMLGIMQSQTGLEARMWGPSIIGFGIYYYKYPSGHSGDAPLVAFSPRKDAMVLYTSLDPDTREEILHRLGKHKTSKGCVYIKKLTDVNLDVVREMIDQSVKNSRAMDVSVN